MIYAHMSRPLVLSLPPNEKAAVMLNSISNTGYHCEWIWFNILSNRICEVWFCQKSQKILLSYNFEHNELINKVHLLGHFEQEACLKMLCAY
jgi:hypothetical protein